MLLKEVDLEFIKRTTGEVFRIWFRSLIGLFGAGDGVGASEEGMLLYLDEEEDEISFLTDEICCCTLMEFLIFSSLIRLSIVV